ncbi:MAG TPA: hypothetical protein VFL86_01825, partial [Burkholderiaceae bacterium]|nr:hypothetical protein [Burkholderiaceae bacterium]
MPNIAEEYEALVQFLYLAPVALAQASLSGEVLMLNPKSAQLLMPLSRDGRLDNLFTVLEGVAPQLRSLVEAFEEPSGVVCEPVRIHTAAAAAGQAVPQVISVSLLKLEGLRLMA